MIVFDLSCETGHRFEGWFGSSAEFERQQQRGLLACPQCGSLAVGKAPMAPAVPRKSNQRREPAPAPGRAEACTAGPMAHPRPLPPELVQALTRLAEAQAEAIKHSTFVGEDFADLCRAMHYGEREPSPIHGQASMDEARELVEEGIPVAPLLIPIVPPDKIN